MNSYLAVNTEVLFPESRGRAAFKFRTVNSFKVESSWKNLTDTAEVVVAKRLFFEDKGKVANLIKAGDPIKIRGGYNRTYYDEFTGFVSEVMDDMPVVLKCEDNMYVLKRTPVHKIWKQVKLQKLLEDIVPKQFKINAMDTDIGDWNSGRKTVAEVLQDLKSFGIYSYFDGQTLVSGKVFTDNPSTEVVKYALDGPRKNIITNDLKYRRKEDIKIKVKITNTASDGKNTSVTVGDIDGEVQKLVVSNISSDAALKQLAENELGRLKYDGFRGGLTSFGIPFVKHGYTASVENNEFPERSGAYYVDSVTTSLNDMGAYRRVARLGMRAAKQ